MDFKKRIQTQQTGFQMAPMIDIMFLLLIYFMAATLYAKWETKVGITVPTADSGLHSKQHDAGEVIINLDEKGRIYINSIEMSRQKLEALLAQIADDFTGQPVIIRADRHTDHEHVVGVLDICRKVDIWNVAFATLPPVDTE
ncbi:MAG: biopolymer transporter ExbD [Lentisphaeria bacterium]|nr:biopolymer transporter ExbD [Lentisphaeria bacterium]